jgi:hypothetical protein
MPFGMHSAAGTFQALVDRLFTPDLEPYVFAYLDDIVISTPDFESHLRILEQVFERLSKAGLTLRESKCEFCQPELRYLGYVVNRQGLNHSEFTFFQLSPPTPTFRLYSRAESPVHLDPKSVKSLFWENFPIRKNK